MPRPRPLRNTSLATRVALVALVVTLVSLGVTALVGLQRGADLANGVTDDRLLSVAAARGESIELGVETVRRQIGALATGPRTAETVASLAAAYRELLATPMDAGDVEELTEFYLTDVVPRLEQVRGTKVGASFLVPDASAAVYLQRQYTMPSDDSGIEPSLVLDPGDGSAYSALHPQVHQTYGQIAIASGFDDLFLISPDDHVVVYSLQKRIEFGTSLDIGPHSGSPLARLVEQLEADPTAGTLVTDFAAYVPAGDRPTMFVAAAIVDGDQPAGYLAVSLPVPLVDGLLSGGGSWSGFGATGDVYLVGPDGTMRSTARAFQESASEFLASAPEEGPGQLTDAQRRRMAETGTTALVQETNRDVVAVDETSVGNSTDYRGTDSRTAVRPLTVEGVEWTIVAEVDRHEFQAPIRDYARQLLFAVALFVVVVTFVAVRWSDHLVAPVRRIATRLRTVRTASEDPHDGLEADRSDRVGPEEYEQLSANVDEMLDRLRRRRAEIAARSDERATLLRRFLPAAVARRSEEGDGEVLDHVRNASVVVMTLDGLDPGLGEDDRGRGLLADIVDEVDQLAAEAGLERVKVTGTSYYAVCGVSRPVLDHAPRSVGFALAARDAVDELSAGRLTARGAVASGPVSTGLAARTGLLYDVWGDAVVDAERLARSTAPGTVVVSDVVHDQLPRDFVVTGGAGGPVVVTTRLQEEGRRG